MRGPAAAGRAERALEAGVRPLTHTGDLERLGAEEGHQVNYVLRASLCSWRIDCVCSRGRDGETRSLDIAGIEIRNDTGFEQCGISGGATSGQILGIF